MIRVEELSIAAGAFRLSGISFEIPAGQYGILMGKTGCGKTALLETLCGLRRSQAGRILLAGLDVTARKAAERGIGYVPQDAALFPTMTVYEHLAFALRIRRWPKDGIEKRVHELSELLGIAHLLKRKPHGLSGGESQRVALGRALSFRPPILCLDEPLSALDHDTRLEMCALLDEVKAHSAVTTIHVTHDHNEAERLADRIFVIEKGAVQRMESTGASRG